MDLHLSSTQIACKAMAMFPEQDWLHALPAEERLRSAPLLWTGRQVPKASETTARQAASSRDAMTDWKNVQVFWMHAGAAPAAGLASYVTTCMPHAMT